MIKHRNKAVLAYKEPWMQNNGLNKFRKIVSEVSSFVGNPVKWNKVVILDSLNRQVLQYRVVVGGPQVGGALFV